MTERQMLELAGEAANYYINGISPEPSPNTDSPRYLRHFTHFDADDAEFLNLLAEDLELFINFHYKEVTPNSLSVPRIVVRWDASNDGIRTWKKAVLRCAAEIARARQEGK